MTHPAGKLLGGFLLLYLAANLLHFSHNAEYLSDYPNLPLWLTRAHVYLAWAGLAAVGVLGYALYRSGRHISGLFLLGAYALSGFGGLLHYARAPLESHTVTMNLTIWFEVVAATILLIGVLATAAKLKAKP